MPKTKNQEIAFTLITSCLMIYFMGVYNISLHTKGLYYINFVIALKSFPIEWAIGFLFAFFIASKFAKKKTNELTKDTSNKMIKILSIQTFTVIIMVPFMSLLGVLESQGFDKFLISNWVQTVVLNFIVAYPLQLVFVGPISRRIFKLFFVKEAAVNEFENA